MFQEDQDYLENYEKYDFIMKTYNKNFADFALGFISIEELAKKEGCSRATIYRKLSEMKEVANKEGK